METERLTVEQIPSWEYVFRNGFAPLWSDDQMRILRLALVEDDITLMQGCTTQPPPLLCVQDWPCEGGCAVGYLGWKSGNNTVGEVEEFFAKACYEADQRLGEPAACRWFLNWFDDTPRDTVRQELTRVIDSILAERASVEHDLPYTIDAQANISLEGKPVKLTQQQVADLMKHSWVDYDYGDPVG